MPIGSPEVSEYVLELKRLARAAENLSSTPGLRGQELHSIFVQAARSASLGAHAVQSEIFENARLA